MLKSGEIPTTSRSERFLLGFILGAISTLIGVLFGGGPQSEAFIAALAAGAIAGALIMFFGQRILKFLEFLLDLLTGLYP
jgi:hypothetical protein